MPELVFTTAHRLGKDEAQRRITEKLRSVRDTYGHHVSDLHETWHQSTLSFGFKAVGMAVSGSVTVEDGEVRLVGQVPRAALIFKRLIERRIRAELGNLLSP